jgi:hypothetical protein
MAGIMATKSSDIVSDPSQGAFPKAGASVGAHPAVLGSVGYYRWTICALLFFATTINYIDRQVIGKPVLQEDLVGVKLTMATSSFSSSLPTPLARSAWGASWTRSGCGSGSLCRSRCGA